MDFGIDDLSLQALRSLRAGPSTLRLGQSDWEAVRAARQVVTDIAAADAAVYGVNTGFGLLAQTRIPRDQLDQLQTNLILSHCAGVGDPLPDPVVRMVIALKVRSLARGFSGVRRELIEALQALLAHDVLPVIPAKGSVGASGDLAPLAHMSAVLMGVGRARCKGREMEAAEGLSLAGLAPITLTAKEGLALINGTQVSTALALQGLFAIEDVFAAGLVAGALSVDALKGSDKPFDPRIHAARGQPGQIDVAAALRGLLEGSGIRASHVDCPRVQDPYSLRCQPQVMGACLDLIRQAARTLEIEAQAVTDNPLVFVEDGEVISGGNFHAEPVAFAADTLALAACEIASISERRLAQLIDPKLSGLPAFLVEHSGLNSGFMIAQVTAAALVSENKTLAHPASIDSIPTSANQEDHVSMAAFAARRLSEIAANGAVVVGVELLAAAQGIDFLRPLRSSPPLEEVHTFIRERVPMWTEDRYMAADIEASAGWVADGTFRPYLPGLPPSG